MKIRTKILIPTMAIAVVTAAAILATVTVIFSGDMDADSAETVEHSSAVMMGEYEKRIHAATDNSTLIAQDAAIQQALAGGDREALLERALYFDSLLEIDFITITDAGGDVEVRAHEPDNYGDSVTGQENVRRALDGSAYATLEAGSAVRLSVRAGVPVYSGGRLVGVVSSGYRLDTGDFVDYIKSLTGQEATVFLGDERISTTVTDGAGQRVVGTKADAAVSGQVLGGETYTGHVKIVGRDAIAKYMPVSSAGGEILGMLFLGTFTDQKWVAVQAFMLQGGMVALAMLALAAAATLIISRRIVAPVKAMVKAADSLADGVTDVEVSVSTKDEVRELAESLRRIIAGSREQERAISAMARGDLTVDVTPRSEHDSVAIALREMLELNNDMFRRIQNAAELVASSSKQLADGSQNLAQGSTEQASVVQQLGASVGTVAAGARENADVATKAAALSESIRGSAERGSEQMRALTDAVNEINTASQSIAGVIKAIDDIAFQTNILALNAAVEAARAGEHGKGFAVVASEVRSLAGKSAEAAKDTGAMIADSIAKAELGVGIARDTAASLKEIVDGINRNSGMVNEIAGASSGTSDTISQINIGIDQVAQVVQQNSATAEESAATAEEMSGQSDMLRALVERFKLKPQASDPKKALRAGGGRDAIVY